MKQDITLTIALAAALAAGTAMQASAQQPVVPFEGWTEPVVSTADDPVWYAMMASHKQPTDDRHNRFLKYDGSELVTEEFSDGVNYNNLTAALLWRLEDAGDGMVRLVSCNGSKEVNVGNATSGSDIYLTMQDEGTRWTVVPSLGSTEMAVEGQYNLQDEGTGAYMNAQNSTAGYHVTLWNGDRDGCSGWFFYEFEYDTEGNTRTVTVTSGDETMGTVGITGHDSGEAEVNRGETVTLTATAAEGYMFYRWVDSASGEVISYDNPCTVEVLEDMEVEGQFRELGYPVMTRYYEVGLNQQNRYIGEATFSVPGYGTTTLFTCTGEDELPFTPYVTLHALQEEGAVIDKTALPVMIDQGTESFDMTIKAYNNNIIYEHDGRTETCEPELVWTRQTLFVDWNNDFDFDDEGEIYESLGNGNGDNDFGDPDGSIEDGWTRTVSIPAGTMPGTYRMRLVYMAPNPATDDWPSKVFHDFKAQLRNGVAYDFTLQINAVTFPVEFDLTGTAADIVTLDVTAGGEALESGETVAWGTPYTVTVTNTRPETAIEVSMSVNGSTVEMHHISGSDTYTYQATAEEAVEIAVVADVVPTFPLTWTVTGDGAYLVETEVITIDDTVETGDMLPGGTEYEITITNTRPDREVKVTMTVNGDEAVLEHDEGAPTYVYLGVIEGATELVIDVTDLSGIGEVAAGGVWYDAGAQILHVGDAVAVTVYDAAGNVVAQGDGTDAVSAAALPSGVYVARAGDTVVKFVK